MLGGNFEFMFCALRPFCVFNIAVGARDKGRSQCGNQSYNMDCSHFGAALYTSEEHQKKFKLTQMFPCVTCVTLFSGRKFSGVVANEFRGWGLWLSGEAAVIGGSPPEKWLLYSGALG